MRWDGARNTTLPTHACCSSPGSAGGKSQSPRTCKNNAFQPSGNVAPPLTERAFQSNRGVDPFSKSVESNPTTEEPPLSSSLPRTHTTIVVLTKFFCHIALDAVSAFRNSTKKPLCFVVGNPSPWRPRSARFQCRVFCQSAMMTEVLNRSSLECPPTEKVQHIGRPAQGSRQNVGCIAVRNIFQAMSKAGVGFLRVRSV